MYVFSAAREAPAASGSTVAVVEPSAKTLGFRVVGCCQGSYLDL